MNKHQKHNRKKQEWLHQQKSWPCLDCGWIGHPAAMDFHHRDPSTKGEKNLTTMLSTRRLAAEIVKCDLLCARCHRLRHVEDGTKPHQLRGVR